LSDKISAFVLRGVLKKLVAMVLTGLSWLKIRANGRILKNDDEPSGTKKGRQFLE